MSEIQGKLITLKQYAEQIGMSYEGARKKLRRYEDELQDHIVVKNRITFIDEYAADFLSEHRRVDTIRVYERNEENEALKEKLIDALERLNSLQELKHKLELNNQEMLHRLEAFDSIKIDLDKLQETINEKQAEIEELRATNATLVESLEAERKLKWWQRFRKKGI